MPFAETLATENHDEAYSPPFYFFSAMDRLATPQFIIPRVRKSNFRCSEETTNLSDLLGLVLGSSLIGQCRVPLGNFQDFIYTMCLAPADTG